MLPWLGKVSVGPSGFRFVRIDSLETTLPVELIEVRAVLVLRDIPTLGSFRCENERLNQIWKTGAYTVHLNMQEYLWDGIKRDRLVWVGDMHPEVSTINAVFGFNDVVPNSLDSARDIFAIGLRRKQSLERAFQRIIRHSSSLLESFCKSRLLALGKS